MSFTGVPQWQKDDLQATALVILETIYSALAEEGPGTSAEAIKRLVVEVFHCNVDQFRCSFEALLHVEIQAIDVFV